MDDCWYGYTICNTLITEFTKPAILDIWKDWWQEWGSFIAVVSTFILAFSAWISDKHKKVRIRKDYLKGLIIYIELCNKDMNFIKDLVTKEVYVQTTEIDKDYPSKFRMLANWMDSFNLHELRNAEINSRLFDLKIGLLRCSHILEYYMNNIQELSQDRRFVGKVQVGFVENIFWAGQIITKLKNEIDEVEIQEWFPPISWFFYGRKFIYKWWSKVKQSNPPVPADTPDSAPT